MRVYDKVFDTDVANACPYTSGRYVRRPEELSSLHEHTDDTVKKEMERVAKLGCVLYRITMCLATTGSKLPCKEFTIGSGAAKQYLRSSSLVGLVSPAFISFSWR